MDIVSKYAALLGQQKLKESFVKDLELVLSRKNPNIEKGKLNFIRYSEMKNWSVRELFGEDLEQADRALINKVYHMLFDIGSDFESVIRMLYSFRNGPKSGIKVADPEDNYEWPNTCVDVEIPFYDDEKIRDMLNKASADIMKWCDKNMIKYNKELKESRSTKKHCEGLRKHIANLERRLLRHTLANVILSIISVATIIALFTLIQN